MGSGEDFLGKVSRLRGKWSLRLRFKELWGRRVNSKGFWKRIVEEVGVEGRVYDRSREKRGF